MARNTTAKFEFETRVATPYGNGIVTGTVETGDYLDLVVDIYGEIFILGAENCDALEDGETL